MELYQHCASLHYIAHWIFCWCKHLNIVFRGNGNNDYFEVHFKYLINFFVFSMILILAIRLMLSDPGIIVASKKVTNEMFDSNLAVASLGNDDYILNYCRTCCLLKNLRVFHCSTCNVCVKKHGNDFILLIRSSLSMGKQVHWFEKP